MLHVKIIFLHELWLLSGEIFWLNFYFRSVVYIKTLFVAVPQFSNHAAEIGFSFT